MRTCLLIALVSSLVAQDQTSGITPEPPTGRSRYWDRIFPYEPTYFACEPIPGDNRPFNAKFQISMAFQVIDVSHTSSPTSHDRPDGFYVAYSQTSLWDLESDSKPFFDSSYRPEFFWHHGFQPGMMQTSVLAIEGGYAHESNGKSPPDSRSQNLLFIKPLLAWNTDDDWQIIVGPRFHAYIGDLLNNDDLSDNPDIARYRGYANLDAAVAVSNGAMLAIRGRIGNEWDRGSLEVDFSYPLDQLTNECVQGYLFMQAFAGYSESLLAYDQRTGQPRVLIGFAITR